VAIVADVRLFRDGLAELIDRADDIEVVAQVPAALAGTIAADAAVPTRPHVVVWDVAGQDGVGAVRAFASAAPEVGVLIVAVDELERDVVRLAEAGMAGYVTREADVHELVRAIRDVAAGELPCSPRVAGLLIRHVGTLAGRQGAIDSTRLTARELEIVRLAGQGMTNKEIAAELSVELSTVKNHVHNALDKLGVHRRTEAAARLGGRPAGLVRDRT
jgi:DNA-binding NarL/FixJ family response regulator